MNNWKKTRNQFPIAEKYVYLNNARFGAMPNSAIEIKKRYHDHLNTHGSWQFDEWISKYEDTRKKVGQLISAPADNIFFLANLSTGINLASYIFPNQDVILLDNDFPSVTLPWQTQARKITSLDYRSPGFYDQLELELKKGNQILCASWIQSFDGYELELNQVYQWAEKYNATLILDGTQGVGAVPFKIPNNIKMLFLTSGFKWLLSGYGVAVAYLSDSMIPNFKSFTGWNSTDGSGAAKTGAGSLEVGNAMFDNVMSMGESLDLILTIGVEAIHARNDDLKNHLITTLKHQQIAFEAFAKSRSSILRIPANEQSIQRLKSQNIQTTGQNGFVRTSHNFFNNREDLDCFINELL